MRSEHRVLQCTLPCAVLWAIVVVSGCGDSSTEPKKTAVICPLTVGNYWVFVDSFISPEGVDVDSSRLEITGMTSVTFDGQTYPVYFWNWYDNETGQPYDFKWLVRIEPDGLGNLGGMSPSDTFLIRSLWIKSATQEGESWRSESVWYYEGAGFSVGDTSDMECVGVNERFTTPAGVLSCYAYRETYDWNTAAPGPDHGLHDCLPAYRRGGKGEAAVHEFVLYYVPDLGYVGSVWRPDSMTTYKRALVRYHLE